MRWHTANRRNRKRSRVRSMDEIIGTWLYRSARAAGASRAEASHMARPALFLYPLVTALKNKLERVKP